MTSDGYVADYISGKEVRATPEEVGAVQVFLKRLVCDYGYRKEQIQSKPQHRVRVRPSDEPGSYPVDIAVFNDKAKTEDGLFMIVECKKPNRNDGEHQLRLYMDMSAAEVGVWFNGEDHLYLRKRLHKDGSRTYETLPNIPRRGQRIEDIGLYRRRDLATPSNLKAVFRDIRNHLAGMATGITRDESLAQEIINVLFCKLLDEQDTAPDDTVSFRAGVGEKPAVVQERIRSLFEKVKNASYGDVFDPSQTLNLDPHSLAYVVGELQNYSIMQADRDAIGDAFEVFIGPALRGAEGQFFTPRNVVEMVISMLDPKPGEMIADPACGSGGFLISALSHVWQRLHEESKIKHWPADLLAQRKLQVSTECFRGVDKDSFLARVCKAYMALIGDGRGGVFCENTLEPTNKWSSAMQEKIQLGNFDVVLTNPPFGKKIVVAGERIISQFELGSKWRNSKGTWTKSTTRRARVPPQILFLERCVQLLKPGGRLGIVLPEGTFGNPTSGYIVHWLRKNVQVRAIINLPEPVFKTSGKGGTHTKVCVLIASKSEGQKAADQSLHASQVERNPDGPPPIFMAEAQWCGHDSRGNPTLRQMPGGIEELLDDLPLIARRFQDWRSGRKVTGHLGFELPQMDIVDTTLVPRYYNPEVMNEIDGMGPDYNFVTLGTLVTAGVVELRTGVEVGKMAYGTGDIPFVRTSDLSNWEIKADPKQAVSEEIYEEHKSRCDIKVDDILFVKDGTYLIGTSVMVTKWDLPMLYQSHIYRLRVRRPEEASPWLLFALLNSPVVRRQVRAKQFTQDIIDTIGNRILELALPFPRSKKKSREIESNCKRIIETRGRLRSEAVNLVHAISHADEGQ